MLFIRYIQRIAICISLALMLIPITSGCSYGRQKDSYGVFLSEVKDTTSLKDYKIVVVDAQYYSEYDLSSIKNSGHIVYSYINIGSIETFRDYFGRFKDLTLGEYENWSDEYWIDVSDKTWQDFITQELVPKLLDKNIDGFFVDNCDIYYNYPEDKILDGLSTIMHSLIDTGKSVIINGGDVFLDAYCSKKGLWSDIITGINQESVFSKILWTSGSFTAASKEDREYFQDYIERYAKKGADIYLLEYTNDKTLASEIRKYCKAKGFYCYISDSLELD